MKHLSDELILRALDEELDAGEAARAVLHLADCPACRARREDLRLALRDVQEALGSAEIPPAGGAPARLRAALGAESATVRLLPRGYALAAGACVMIAAMIAAGGLSETRVSAAYLPDTRLTPGATTALSREQLCGSPGDDGVAVPEEVARRVFDQYRIREPRPGAYEVDYLITPSLGGSGEIGNLWPQPYSDGEWNARVKDALEDHLRVQVCSGRMELEAAQREIAADWVAAYRKHFRTDRPLASHAMFVKDRPWEGPSSR